MPNPYPPGFLDLAATTEGPILDCGSGGRTHPDIISLEYTAHPNNTVQGDALTLPFRTDTFDLVLSQAVLEHVADPQACVDEMFRVLRPGGLLWVDAAFMQPVHMPPIHFFNITPFGLAHLCRRFDVVEQGAFGGLADTFDWLCREAGLSESHRLKVRRALGPVELDATRMHNVASAVHLIGRKPWTSPSSCRGGPDASTGNATGSG